MVEESKPRRKYLPLVRLPLYLGSSKINGLVDTGAQISLISLEIYGQIENEFKKMVSSENEIFITFRSATGSLMQPLGLVEIQFCLTPNTAMDHSFYIIRDLHESCILGLDFIDKFNLVVYPLKRKLKFSLLREGCAITRVSIPLPIYSAASVTAEPAPKFTFDISHLTDENQRNLMATFLRTHDFAFAYSMNDLRCAKGVEHAINTTGGPVAQKVRRLAHTLRPIVKAHIDSMLECGIIRESCSPWASPIVMTPKKAPGEWRFCVDYRVLNDLSSSDAYPIPRIDDALSSLYGCKFFSTLDLFAGYHQILVKPSDQMKTAFICEFGLYEYIRLPFGLSQFWVDFNVTSCRDIRSKSSYRLSD